MSEKKLKVLEYTKISSAYPTQWIITAIDTNNNKYELYIRYRSNLFFVEIRKFNGMEWISMDVIKHLAINGFADNFLLLDHLWFNKESSEMSTKEMKRRTKHILEWKREVQTK